MSIPQLFEISQVHAAVASEDGTPVIAEEGFLLVQNTTDQSLWRVADTTDVRGFFNLNNLPSLMDSSDAVQAESVDDPGSTAGVMDEENGNDFRWREAAILALLAAYKENEHLLHSGKVSCKKFWEKVSVELCKADHHVTGGQCKSKMTSLKKTYKSVKDHNGKSGNCRRTWPFFEALDEMFGKKPWAAPLSEAQSTAPPVEETAKKNTEPPRKRAKSDAVVEALQKSAEERRIMHAELLQRQDEFLRLMKEMVSQKNK